MECANPYCQRHLENENSRFYIWAPYCSRYCGLFTSQKMKPALKTITCTRCGQQGHTRRSKSCTAEEDVIIKKRPAVVMQDIHVSCDVCNKLFPLHYRDPRKGSQTFCSNECYRKLKMAGKHSYRDYQLLKILREMEPILSSELSRILQNHNFGNYSQGIGMILHLWIARRYVKQDYDGLYYYKADGPLGKIVIDHQS